MINLLQLMDKFGHFLIGWEGSAKCVSEEHLLASLTCISYLKVVPLKTKQHMLKVLRC